MGGCQVNALKEVILNSFYFGTDVVVLKELILNSFYFVKHVVVLTRTDFEQFGVFWASGDIRWS